jgi:Phospholipase_D-nuclease N-terminal/Short C-terminal domain
MIPLEYSVWDTFLSVLWFFLFFLWIWLLITIFADLFRSHDLSGWAKAGWTVLLIVLPYLGVLIYLIARGSKMSEHAAQDARRQDAMMRAYVRDAADTPGPAEQIERLAALQRNGDISTEEYEQAKAKILAS